MDGAVDRGVSAGGRVAEEAREPIGVVGMHYETLLFWDTHIQAVKPGPKD